MRVVGITGKDEHGNFRKETAEGVFEGDAVGLDEYEDDDGNPVVRVCVDIYSNELGRLTKTDAKKIYPFLSEGRKIVAQIFSVEEEEDNDGGKKFEILITVVVF
jgi:hypothetical protein